MGNFEDFTREWGDYIWELTGGEEITQDEYTLFYREFVSRPNYQIFRMINVNEDWVDHLTPSTPLGLFWTKNKSVTNHFSGWTHYDDRFDKKGNLRVLLIGRVKTENIDINSSIASQIASAEEEIRVIKGRPILLEQVWVKDRALTINKQFPA